MKAAVVQLSPGADISANLERAGALVRAACDAGAALIVLPEAFASGYDAVAWADAAERAGGPTHAALARWARETGAWIVGGAIVRAGGAARSSALLASPHGGIVARYAKRVLWAGETASLEPGTVPVARATPIGTIGLLVCYDVEFPELARPHAKAGAHALTVSAAFSTGSIWDVATRARALENALFVLGANLGPPRFCGGSRIVAPDGSVLAGVDGAEGFAVAPIDWHAYDAWRDAHPYREDLRRLALRGL